MQIVSEKLYLHTLKSWLPPPDFCYDAKHKFMRALNRGRVCFWTAHLHEQNLQSTGYKVRFKQLVVVDSEYDLHTVEYTYDAISRLLEARYNPGTV